MCLVFPGSICDIIPSNTVKRHLIFFPTHLVVDSSISVTNLVTDKLNLGNTRGTYDETNRENNTTFTGDDDSFEIYKC